MNNSNKLIRNTCFNHKTTKQAGAELGQFQLKLKLSFSWFKIFCIKLTDKILLATLTATSK